MINKHGVMYPVVVDGARSIFDRHYPHLTITITKYTMFILNIVASEN